jgi:phenylalanyl-tRNA synthetase beta chain
MKVLLSWLRDFAPVEGDPDRIGDQLSDLGLTVEQMSILGEGLDGIVVARVLDLRPHPDADRIQLVDVDAGDGEALQICCGAFNMSVGDLVPLATLGTVMPGGMEIARRKMRGEWSNGMLCASTEIGLGDDDDGIMLLDTEAAPGAALTEALDLRSDVLYDLEVNPNRPDAMSVAGVARDLAARQGVPFALPDPDVAESGDGAAGRVSVEILDPELCGRFGLRILDGVSVGTSPRWLVNRLNALGQRSINSVVDASNYVMLELGQPNHTYDLTRVAGGAFRIRRAGEGEAIQTLDGVERTLTAADGVIADGDDVAVGIAGIMGGANTEIGAGTTTVALEMAWWDPKTIAASARRLGLRSEASARFERGCDPEVVELAMRRFADPVVGDAVGLAGVYAAYPWCGHQFADPTVGATRVRAIVGDQDDWLSVQQVQAQVQAIRLGGGDASLRIVAGAAHSFDRREAVHEVPEAAVAPLTPTVYVDDDGAMIDPATGRPDDATTDRDMFLAAVRAGLGRLGAHIGSVGDQPDLFRADMLAFHASVLGPPS